MSDNYTATAAIITLTATIGALMAKLQTQNLLSKDDVDNTISAAMAAAINGNPDHREAIEASFKTLFPFAEILELRNPDTPLN